MRTLLCVLAAAATACRAGPEMPEIPATHPASPAAVERPAAELLGPASAVLEPAAKSPRLEAGHPMSGGGR